MQVVSASRLQASSRFRDHSSLIMQTASVAACLSSLLCRHCPAAPSLEKALSFSHAPHMLEAHRRALTDSAWLCGAPEAVRRGVRLIVVDCWAKSSAQSEPVANSLWRLPDTCGGSHSCKKPTTLLKHHAMRREHSK